MKGLGNCMAKCLLILLQTVAARDMGVNRVKLIYVHVSKGIGGTSLIGRRRGVELINLEA